MTGIDPHLLAFPPHLWLKFHMMKLQPSNQNQLAQDFLAGFYSKVSREEALVQMDPKLSAALGEVSDNHSEDLLTNLRVNFSWPTYQEISHHAGERLAQAWLERKAQIHSASQLRDLWHDLAADFHRNNFWGFPQQQEEAELPADPEVQRQKEGLSYIWMALQSLILMKIIILVFGIRFSNEPNLTNALIFFTVLILAFGGLFFFAYRWRNRSS